MSIFFYGRLAHYDDESQHFEEGTLKVHARDNRIYNHMWGGRAMIHSIQTKISAYPVGSGSGDSKTAFFVNDNMRRKAIGCSGGELHRDNESAASVFEKMRNTSKVQICTAKAQLAPVLQAWVKEKPQRMENDDYIIQEEMEPRGYWSVQDKKTGEVFAIDPGKTSLQTYDDKRYLVSEDFFGVMGIQSAGDKLISSLREFMNVEKLPVGQTSTTLEVTTHAETGICVFREKGKSDHFWMPLENDAQKEALQRLASVYRESYPTQVQTDDAALTLARLEAAGNVVRTDNGFMMITGQGIEFYNEKSPNAGWWIPYADGADISCDEVMKAVRENRIVHLEDYDFWKKWMEEQCEKNGKN